jgi:hypothetical protein
MDAAPREPPKELIAEAVKQLRNVLGLFVTTCLLWLVTADAVLGSLQVRERAKHVAAWLVVKNSFGQHLTELTEHEGNEPIKCFDRLVPVQSGTEVPICEPFSVSSPWHSEALITMELLPIGELRSAYRVAAATDNLPVSHYAVATVGGSVSVIPAKFAVGERLLSNAVLRDGNAAPEYWPTTRTHLHARGWKGQTSKDLQLNDPNVASFIKDGFSASYSVSGIPFSPGYFPSAVAGFLGILSFLLLGPWHALRRATNRPESDPWVLITRAEGRSGLLMSLAQRTLVVFVILLPLLVLGSQTRLAPYLSSLEYGIWLPLTLALLFASGVLAAAAQSLLRLRAAVQ